MPSFLSNCSMALASRWAVDGRTQQVGGLAEGLVLLQGNDHDGFVSRSGDDYLFAIVHDLTEDTAA